MQKIFKRISILLMVAISAVCLMAFTACGDDEGKPSKDGKITITVLAPDGKAVNGHTDGNKLDGDLGIETALKIQFCIAGDEGSCNSPKTLGADGKITLDIQRDIVGQFQNIDDSAKFELHVMGADSEKLGCLVNGGYGTFTKAEMPGKLTITLKAA